MLKHQPRHLAMAPPLVQFLAKSPDATPKHFESLEKVFLALNMYNCWIHNQSVKSSYLVRKHITFAPFRSLDSYFLIVISSNGKLIDDQFKVFVGAAPVGESLILEFLKKAPAAEFREVNNLVKVKVKLIKKAWGQVLRGENLESKRLGA